MEAKAVPRSSSSWGAWAKVMWDWANSRFTIAWYQCMCKMPPSWSTLEHARFGVLWFYRVQSVSILNNYRNYRLSWPWTLEQYLPSFCSTFSLPLAAQLPRFQGCTTVQRLHSVSACQLWLADAALKTREPWWLRMLKNLQRDIAFQEDLHYIRYIITNLTLVKPHPESVLPSKSPTSMSLAIGHGCITTRTLKWHTSPTGLTCHTVQLHMMWLLMVWTNWSPTSQVMTSHLNRPETSLETPQQPALFPCLSCPEIL